MNDSPTRPSSKTLLVLCAFLICGLLGADVCAQGDMTTIAKRGDSANFNGFFNEFEFAHINEQGRILFIATNMTGTNFGSNDNKGIFALENGVQSQIVRTGNTLPNGSTQFLDLYWVYQNNAGQLVFSGLDNPRSPDDRAIFIHDPTNGITEVIREGDPAPSNGDFGSVSAYYLNDSGQFLIRSLNMTGTAGGTADDQGMFLFNGALIEEVAREGDPVPGGGGGMISGFSNFQLTESSKMLFRVSVTGSSDEVIFSRSGGVNTKIARTGDAAPGGGNFVSLSGVPRINDSGQVVFLARTSSEDYGLYIYDGVELSKIIGSGDSALGDGVLTYISWPDINERGQVAFDAGIDQSSSGNQGAFLYDAGTLREIARRGENSPNGIPFGTLSGRSINDAGQVFFESNVAGNPSLFLSDAVDTASLQKTGDIFDGETITDLDRMNLGEHGQAITRLVLSGGGHALQMFTPDATYRQNVSGEWDDPASWFLSTKPSRPHDVFIRPDASLTVNGPAAADVNINTLAVGIGQAISTLNLQSGRDINAEFEIEIYPNAIVTGDGSLTGNGGITNSGTILAENVRLNGPVTNYGVVTGDGRVIADNFLNWSSGEIRVESNQYLEFSSGSFENRGLIDVVEGTLDFSEEPVFNANGTGLIFARDAVLRFENGLDNYGGVGISFGATDIHGGVYNDATGVIALAGGANVTFLDDVFQNGVLEVASSTNSTSIAVFFGSFSGAGGFSGGGDVYALGDLRPGNSPASVLMGGNLFMGFNTQTHVEIEGENTGEFDQLVVTGDLSLGGTLEVSFPGSFTPSQGQQFIIAQVDGDASGQFQGVNEGDLVGTFANVDLFLTYQGGDGNDVVVYSDSIPVVVGPDTLTVTRGVHVLGTVADLGSSNNVDVTISRSESDTQSRTEFELKSFSPVANPDSLELTLEGSVFARTNVIQTIELYDYASGVWELVDTRNASRFIDRVDSVTVGGDLSRFVEAGTFCIEARIHFQSPISRQQFTSNTDHFVWSIGL